MIEDYKITTLEINQKNVQSAPDVLSNDAQDNKAVFDNLVEYFIGKYNDLIDHIKDNYISTDEVGAGLTYVTDLEWTHALHKGAQVLEFSGLITEDGTGGYRTLLSGSTSIPAYVMNDCVVNINGTDYQCGDAVQNYNIVTTSCEVEGVTVTFTLDLTAYTLVMSSDTNPFDTLVWNVQLYPTTATTIPSKALPDTTGRPIDASRLVSSVLSVASKSTTVSSITPYGAKTGTIGISRTGYTPIGIIGFEADKMVMLNKVMLNGNNAEFTLYNVGSSIVSNISVTVIVLYIRDA